MQVEVPVEELRKRSLMVATPMYGGQCYGGYTLSMIKLAIACCRYGIDMRVHTIFNESLITRARAYCVQAFLDSDCTHLMFIDSDITFDPDSVLTLLALQSDDSPYDVITGAYPKKCISWEKIKQAVDKGVADEDPNVLGNFVGDYVFNLAGGQTQMRLDEPVELLEAGTGFMMIRRDVFTKFADTYPELKFKPDHVRTEGFDGSRELTMFFDTVIDPTSKRYLSEDYMFCQYVRNMGGRVWLCPWIKLQHTGTYVYGGSLHDLASIGAVATADVSKIGKKKSTERPILQ